MKSFWSDERGGTAIEYGLIAAFIGVGIVVSLTSLQGSLTSLFSSIDEKIPN
jgi:pilus assembly protein Flp/PilA